MGECLYVWEHSAGCENNKAAEWAVRGADGTPTGLPVAQSAMNVSVCLRIIASLSLGRGSLCMMCSMKSLGMTEAMFHLSFPRTTSSQSYKDNDQRKKKKKKVLWFSFCSQDHSSFWLLGVWATQGYAERTIPFNGCAAMAPLTVKQNQCDPVPRKWLCKES